MKRYALDIAPDVLEQVREQTLFIARDSIVNALEWEDRINAAIGKLADVQGHAVDEDLSKILGYSVRRVVFERTYLIFYHVDEKAEIVRVLRFRHGARLPFSE